MHTFIRFLTVKPINLILLVFFFLFGYVTVVDAQLTNACSDVSGVTATILSVCANGQCRTDGGFTANGPSGGGNIDADSTWQITYGGATAIFNGACSQSGNLPVMCSEDTTHTHNGLTFTIRQNGSDRGTGSSASTDILTCSASSAIPGIPTGLIATPQACGTNQLFLDWNDSANATSYSVYLSNGTFIGNSVGSNYTFTGLPNTSYSFYVRANNSAGVQSGNSATANGTTPNICSPAAPTGLTATPQACGTNQLFLDWNDVSGATSYSVYYSNGTWIGNTVGSNYTFTGGTNLSYSFYVRANNSSGVQSGNSAVQSGTTPASCPSNPNLRINGSDGPLSVNYNTVVNLTWTSAHPSNCTLSGAGVPGSASVTPNSPSGGRNATVSQSSTYVLTCGSQTDSVQVNLNAQAPNAPTINFPSGSTAGVVGAPVEFRIVSTHPNPNSQFYYTIDWDNNGSPDAPSPSPTYTSGQQWTIANTWPAAGSYTIRACARDVANSLPAACTNHTVTIASSAPPSMTLQSSVAGGVWVSGNPTINPGESLALRWTSVGASSCTATAGSGFSTGGLVAGTDSSVNPPAPGTNAAYTVSCAGPGGTANRTVTVTTRNYPNFTQPDITYNLSPTFNSVTGMYDYINIVFQTRNDGGSNTLTNASYQLQFDRSRDGYDYTTTGSLGLLPVGSTVNRTEQVLGSVPFGLARARVFVDNTNSVTEINEGDNIRVFDFIIPPPSPNVQLEADRYQVRRGETVTLTWSTNATYPMNCQVFGPGVDRNPSGTSGTQVSNPINAKSTFTFRCLEPVTNTTFSDSVEIGVVGELEEI